MVYSRRTQHRDHASTTHPEVRPFRIDVPEEDLVDLRRRIAATRWPSKELVEDRSQGVQLATLRELARYWADDYDWRRCEAKLNALPQFTTEIDGVDVHFIHVKSPSRGRFAADHHARLARLGHRDAGGRRPAHRPHRARRERRGRLRPRAAVPARLRLLRRAEGDRLGPRPDGAGLGGADESPRLHPLRRPGRRRGRRRHRRDGPPGAGWAGRPPHQPARAGAERCGLAAGADRAGTRCARRDRDVPVDRQRLLRGACPPGRRRSATPCWTHRSPWRPG